MPKKNLLKLKNLKKLSSCKLKITSLGMLFGFNPLSARIFTVFGHFIRGQSVTQRSMGRKAPRYPPQYQGT